MSLPAGFTLDDSQSLPEGFELDAAPATASPIGAAEDIAKSLPTGVAKGVINIAGIPGQLYNGMRYLTRGAARYFSPDLTDAELDRREAEYWKQMNDPEHMKTMAAFGEIPSQPLTGEDIKGQVEKLTGPLHEPQTPLGKGAETVGEFVPTALAGPEGVGANILKLAVMPGVASEAAGQALAGTPWEGPARFIAALIGTGGAIGASKAAQAGKNYLAARAAGQELGPDINAGAVSRMAKSYAADKLTPDIVAAKADQLGPEAMTLDMGRQMQGRAEAIAAQPGEGQNTVLNATEKRVHGTDQFGNVNSQFGAATADRIKQTLDQQLGLAHNKVDLLNRVSGVVDSVARPMYDSVMAAHPVVDVPADITSRPAIASAMKNATTLAKQYGEELESPTETKTILSGPGYHIADDVTAPAKTSLRYWDYVKKDMDRRINAYMKSGGTSELNSAHKADLGGLIDARNALRDHLDEVTNGDYANARRVAAFKPQLTEAYETGRSAFNNRLLPEEFADQVNNMSAPEQVMAKAGYRRELERMVDTARNDGAAARKMLDTNSNLQKTEDLFGPQARQAVEDRIAAETKFQQAANNIAGNSRTQVRGQLAKDTESPSAATPPQANITGFLYKGGLGTLDYLRNQGMEKTRAAIGRMATMRGPELSNLADVLANYNAKRAANYSPVPTQVGALARMLALGPSGPVATGNPPR